jgi:hypothetical protein
MSRILHGRRSFLHLRILLLFGMGGLGGVQMLTAEEEQSQGYRFEREVILRLAGREELGTTYTEEWDIPAQWNQRTGLPVSIKFIRWGNAVYLGDALRQRKITMPFEMVVGFYDLEKESGQVRVLALHHLTIQPEAWKKWWGGVTEAELEQLSGGIKNKPLAEAQRYGRESAARLRDKSVLFSINPKVNQDQRRIQCSIPFQKFYQQVVGKEAEPQKVLLLWQKPFPEFFQAGMRSRQER